MLKSSWWKLWQIVLHFLHCHSWNSRHPIRRKIKFFFVFHFWKRIALAKEKESSEKEFLFHFTELLNLFILIPQSVVLSALYHRPAFYFKKTYSKLCDLRLVDEKADGKIELIFLLWNSILDFYPFIKPYSTTIRRNVYLQVKLKGPSQPQHSSMKII